MSGLPVVRGSLLDQLGRPYTYVGGIAAQMLGGEAFRGASSGTRAGALWSTSSGSADADLEAAQKPLRDRAADQVRNNPIARSTLLTLDSNVIGTGLTLNPEINAQVLGISEDEAHAIGEQIQTVWQLFAESKESDTHRQRNFFQQQRLAYWSSRDRGDVLCVLTGFSRGDFPFRTRVQLIEADQVSTPPNEFGNGRITMGVERDGNGAPLSYRVQRGHPGDVFRTTRDGADSLVWDSVPAFGRRTGRKTAWLVYSAKRPSQSRGIPYISVALETLKQLDRYTTGELMASIIGGTATLLIKSPGVANLGTIISTPLGDDTGQKSQGEGDIALDYGAIYHLKPDEDVVQVAPNRPNTAYADFVRAASEQVGAGLGIPVELLLKRFSNSFSAATAAKQEAGKVFSQERKEFATDFCQPVYETVVTEAVLNGMLSLPGFLDNPIFRQAYLRADWQGPDFGSMRPLEEVRAASAKIDAGLSNKAIEIPRLTGHAADDVTRQRQREIEREGA